MSSIATSSKSLQSYIVVTTAYWAFMLTDGALRMLVLLHFHILGFTPVQLAYLFLLYELMGIVTNAVAGWLGTRFGLQSTLVSGLFIQTLALLLLAMLDPDWSLLWSVVFVMLVQALSGVAKDLTKTSAKSAIKQLAPANQGDWLFRMVALLTGSKNAIKGLGYFLGAVLLALYGFTQSVYGLAALLSTVLVVVSLINVTNLGLAKRKTQFSEVFQASTEVKRLSIARVFLFGARDTWFVVAVPVFLHGVFSNTFSLNVDTAFFAVGAFMAVWIIGYGYVQARTPYWIPQARESRLEAIKAARDWAARLFFTTATLAVLAVLFGSKQEILVLVLITGLFVFGVVFAINSSLHSYLIVELTVAERAALDVGFYYMANATGRLIGTLLSGLTYQVGGLFLSLCVATLMTAVSWYYAHSLQDRVSQ